MSAYTLSHSEKSEGWTSFWSYLPDGMIKLSNRFYTVKNGQLYLHNEDTGVRNTFYGVQHSSKITFFFNESNSEDKIFKTMVLEGNKPWNAIVNTNYTNSSIKKEEFDLRESRHFAYMRKNENAEDMHGNSAQGIGVISAASGLTISFSQVSEFVSIGDKLYQLNGANNELIGTITQINTARTLVTVNAITTAPTVGFYSFSKKESRIEGGEVRGYYMEVELVNSDTEKVELFAVNTNAIKSYV
ncbi:hypothetical protein [Flavobacterium sp. FlaQc-50]|uniref:hypothetical protein n=1 Tax=unclassified Flavobacterium TaxID=196869 RepID=UPI003757B060